MDKRIKTLKGLVEKQIKTEKPVEPKTGATLETTKK
jgi:hypothetical protein